jgi:hypothetical protein
MEGVHCSSPWSGFHTISHNPKTSNLFTNSEALFDIFHLLLQRSKQHIGLHLEIVSLQQSCDSFWERFGLKERNGSNSRRCLTVIDPADKDFGFVSGNEELSVWSMWVVENEILPHHLREAKAPIILNFLIDKSLVINAWEGKKRSMKKMRTRRSQKRTDMDYF